MRDENRSSSHLAIEGLPGLTRENVAQEISAACAHAKFITDKDQCRRVRKPSDMGNR